MDKVYTYQRKDGGTTDCYGKLLPNSNIEVTCDNELYDGIITDNDWQHLPTWQKVCERLELTYNPHIEQMIAI